MFSTGAVLIFPGDSTGEEQLWRRAVTGTPAYLEESDYELWLSDKSDLNKQEIKSNG